MAPQKSKTIEELFLAFHYPELKDLGKHFLTVSSAAVVFLLTFMEKLKASSPSPSLYTKWAFAALIVSAIFAGIGLFTNYVAGAGASGGIIWGLGRNYRSLTICTYVLYIGAGSGMVLGLVLLTLQSVFV